MGGLNSSFTVKTKRVLLFVQTYNKQLIRRTSMLTGQRTIAATYFEKGLDEERVEATLAYGVKLLESYAGATVASEVTDIQSKKYLPRTISFTLRELNYKIGVEIDPKQIHHILTSLGFGVRFSGSKYVVMCLLFVNMTWRSSRILWRKLPVFTDTIIFPIISRPQRMWNSQGFWRFIRISEQKSKRIWSILDWTKYWITPWFRLKW